MNLLGRSLIAGKPGTTGGAVFHALNPATGAALEPAFCEALLPEVDAAVHAAADAFETSRLQPAEARARLLETMAAEIEALGDALLARAQAETGLPLPRLTGERARTCGQLRLFAAVVREGSWVDARMRSSHAAAQPSRERSRRTTPDCTRSTHSTPRARAHRRTARSRAYVTALPVSSCDHNTSCAPRPAA